MARNRTIITESGSRYVLYEGEPHDTITRFSEKPIFDSYGCAVTDVLVVDAPCVFQLEPEVGHSWLFRTPYGPVRTTRVVKIEEDAFV